MRLCPKDREPSHHSVVSGHSHHTCLVFQVHAAAQRPHHTPKQRDWYFVQVDPSFAGTNKT